MRTSKAGHDIVRLTIGVSMPPRVARTLDKPQDERASVLIGPVFREWCP